LAAELIQNYEPEIESLTLIPSSGGAFEITVNDRLLYSKLTNGRHAEPGEVNALVGKYLKEGHQ